MNTEEREEAQPRPRKVIPAIRRENNLDQESERRPYNQNYSRPEGNSYERRPYNNNRPNGGGYGAYGDNRPPYGDRPARPRMYENREGGYNNRPYNNGGGNRNYGNTNREGGYANRPSYGNNRPYNNDRPAYNNDRPAYNNDRPAYNNNRPAYNNDRPMYGNDRPYNPGGSYNRPSRPNYEGGRVYTATPSQEGGAPAEGIRKRRPRVGDSRVTNFEAPRDNRLGNRPVGMGGNRFGHANAGGPRKGGGFPNQHNQRPRTADYNPNAKYNFQKQLKYKEVLADPNEPIRLNKFLSNAGVCSRREADEYIQAGAVKVNDQVVTELGTKITRQDKVLFQDQEVQIESKVYIVLNKPKNCVTTSDDPQERLTVMDLVKNACSERIYPVGRLDRNTTGVLLLTNDGDLASKLTHPSFKKKKIYHVWLDKDVLVEDMEKIANGLELEDGEIHADAISYASDIDKKQVGIEIHSGRNRIVRRIFESLGYHVVKLDRVYFAGLTKKNLGRGKWRYLNEREVNALRMGAFE